MKEVTFILGLEECMSLPGSEEHSNRKNTVKESSKLRGG